MIQCLKCKCSLKIILTGKIIKKILLACILVILILITGVFTLFTVIRAPMFQELAGRLAADFITRKYHSTVYIDKIRVSGRLSIDISGLKVDDYKGNPILELDRLQMKIGEFSIRNHRIKLDRLSLTGGGFYLRIYEGDSLLNLNWLFDAVVPPAVDSEVSAPQWMIQCNKLTMDDLSFGFTDDRKEHVEGQMDFNNLWFTDIYLNLSKVSVIGDSIAAVFEHFSCNEKSGISLYGFYGDSRVSSTGIRVDELKVVTNRSSLDFDLEFLYNGYDKLGYFLDSVYIHATMRSSLLTLSDIGYFAPVLFEMVDPVMFDGEISGYVSDFSANEFRFKFGSFTAFDGRIRMTGLPDFESTFVQLDINQFVTIPDDLAQFHLPLDPPELPLPAPLAKLGFTTIRGKYRGYMDDFTANLRIQSDLGRIGINARLSRDPLTGAVFYVGDIEGEGIELGLLTEQKDIGAMDVEMEFEGKGLDLEEINLVLNGWVENLVYRNYRYDKIVLGGELKGMSYNGRLFILDPSLSMSFDGLVDFNPEFPELNFTLEIDRAKLFDLNLADRSPDMNLHGLFSGDFTGLDPESFRGNIRIDSMVYTENGVDYELIHLELDRTRNMEAQDNIVLRSDFVDADMVGRFGIRELIPAMTDFVVRRTSDSTWALPADSEIQQVDFDIRLKDISPVTEIFLPLFSLSPGATIKGGFNSGNQSLDFAILADWVNVSGIRIRDIDLAGSSLDRDFFVEGKASQVILREDADTVTIGVKNFSIQTKTALDSIVYIVRWDNLKPDQPNSATISGFVRFPEETGLETGIKSAEANLGGEFWQITGENLISIQSGDLRIDNLNISKGDEQFIVDGALTHRTEDTLRMIFADWSLANFNPLIRSYDIELDGVINGNFGISRDVTVPNIFADISITEFTFNQVYFGQADFKTHWIESDKALDLNVDIFSKGELSDRYKILGVSGVYSPFNESQNFDFNIVTQNLNISILKPLLTSFSSNIGGFATGNLSLKGSLSQPVLTGSLKLQRAELMVDYLNVTYSFSNEVKFEENFIQLANVSVFDPGSNQALLTGGIRHKYFKDMLLDLKIEPQKFLGFDLSRYQNNVFYGKAYATGTVSLTGPFDNISINVDVSTEKGTNVFIPIQYSVDVSQGDFIVFTNEADTVVSDSLDEIKVEGMDLDIGMHITRDADIEIILPGNIGFIRATGDGKLRLGVDPNGYLTMDGSYRIQSGLFVFSLEQLVSRRFDILEGSRISWTGDINDAEVSIVARYRLRTSLAGLGISMIDPDAASQKIIVFTDIRLTGSLFNPDLSFGITFPNLPEQTRQAAYAVLDTNDLGLMNQQAISLLVLGSFSSTGTGGSNPVSAAAIVSSTLSNMLSQISNDFNIGINYFPGDQVSDEQIELALSTQLLDDRLIIDGNIDVTGSNTSSQKTSSIVGDFNLEYKLTPDGRFRVKAFNRSNDLSLFNDYSPYTQGVGIFYRKEFNNVREIFTRSRKTKPDPGQKK